MITDDTLREGLQTPGISFTIMEKEHLASLLSKAGIKRALVSYPSAHKSEVDVTRTIVKSRYFDQVFALGRTMVEDVDMIDNTGANISLHLPFRLENLDRIREAIKYASRKDKIVEVAVVSVVNHSIDEVLKLVKLVTESGANIVQLPDTTGQGTPAIMNRIVRQVLEHFHVDVEIHCHNDSGGAVSNTLAGRDAGAVHLDTCVLGLGERNGIADIATIANLMELDGEDTGIRMSELRQAYDYVIQMVIDKIGENLFIRNLPVFGQNTGIHTAGTHAAFSDVFTGGGFSVNVYTGKSMIRDILKLENLMLSDDVLIRLVQEVKNLAVETGRVVQKEQIMKMARELQ